MIDEKSRRRPSIDVDNSVPVVLFDGQEWLFPKPWIELAPDFSGTAADVCFVHTLGIDFEREVERARAASDDESPASLAAAMFGLARSMLDVNYQIDPNEYTQILRYGRRDEASRETWQRIFDIASGVADGDTPKPAPDGSD